jgi:plasmid stabilization system protein ParE
MTRLPVSVSPRAEREALAAARWYEAKNAGLGLAFLDEVEHTLEDISENPLRFAVLHRDVRRARTRRFLPRSHASCVLAETLG